MKVSFQKYNQGGADDCRVYQNKLKFTSSCVILSRILRISVTIFALVFLRWSCLHYLLVG